MWHPSNHSSNGTLKQSLLPFVLGVLCGIIWMQTIGQLNSPMSTGSLSVNNSPATLTGGESARSMEARRFASGQYSYKGTTTTPVATIPSSLSTSIPSNSACPACPSTAVLQEQIADLTYKYRMASRRLKTIAIHGPQPWSVLPYDQQRRFSMDWSIQLGKNMQRKEPDGFNSGNSSPGQSSAIIFHEMKWEKSHTGSTVPVWSRHIMDTMINAVKRGEDTSVPDYPYSVPDLQKAAKIHGGVDGLHIAVAGSICPWVETAFLAMGAASTSTIDYNLPISEDPRAITVAMEEVFTSNVYYHKYSLLVSYSSLEHDGLGRYGDPFNPEGDLIAISEYNDILKPGGLVFLGIPTACQDQIHFNSHRIYGAKRLELLFQEFDVLGCVNRGEWYSAEDGTTKFPPTKAFNAWDQQPVWVLRTLKEGQTKPTLPFRASFLQC